MLLHGLDQILIGLPVCRGFCFGDNRGQTPISTILR